MGGVPLLIPVLVLAALGVFAFYRLSVQREKERTAPAYNLGIACPDGVASSPCPHCGQVFGAEVTEAARLECESGLKAAPVGSQSRADLVAMFHSIWWNVVCPSCGEQSSYVPQAQVLLHQGK